MWECQHLSFSLPLLSLSPSSTIFNLISLFEYKTPYTGKSTLLSALSGKLTPKDGSRIEGDGLELGVFTQDLAQDLVSENRVNIVALYCRMHVFCFERFMSMRWDGMEWGA